MTATRAFAAVAFAAIASAPTMVLADEGGVSFWLPGLFGILAAVPQQPGWSVASIYYHTSVSASGDVARAREIAAGRISGNFTGTLSANLNAHVDLGLLNACAFGPAQLRVATKSIRT